MRKSQTRLTFGRQKLGGFTMVEVAVMLSIFSLIAGIVLVSFPRLSERINLQRSSRQLALALRRAQNMAFAVRQVQTPSGRRTPPAYGVYISRATPASSYIIFADLPGAGGPADGRFVAADDVVVETIPLDTGIKFGRLYTDIALTNQQQQVLNIAFSVPEARMALANASSPVGESAQICLISKRGAKANRNVTVRTTGQISVK